MRNIFDVLRAFLMFPETNYAVFVLGCTVHSTVPSDQANPECGRIQYLCLFGTSSGQHFKNNLLVSSRMKDSYFLLSKNPPHLLLSVQLRNTVRCRFGKPFELPLLAQSFIMIATMLIVLYLVVRVRQRTTQQTRRHFRGTFT